MKLISVKIGNASDLGWQISTVQFKKLNLFVGESASGKSIFINFLFEVGTKVAQDVGHIVGYFLFKFQHAGVNYEWEIDSRGTEEAMSHIAKERLTRFSTDNSPTLLVERDADSLKVKDTVAPKLASTSTSIFLFREDPDIKPVHDAFKSIMRRDFAGDALNQSTFVAALRRNAILEVESTKSLNSILLMNLPVSARIFFLKRCFSEKYTALLNGYRTVFPFVEQFELRDMNDGGGESSPFPGQHPVLYVKDRNIDNSVPLRSLSSGMKKVLLLMTDILMLPSEMVYLIDEYENSLGLNAINFLPTFLAEHGENSQFIVTSHHPYLINAIPVTNWVLFHRKGINVSVKHGDDLAESYGKSKQQAFIKLLNDPFFTDGK